MMALPFFICGTAALVSPERQLPFFVGDIFDRFEGRLMGGIVYKDIHSAHLRSRLFDHRATVVGVPDVSRHQDGLASGFLDETFCFLCILVLIQI
jgi:hypothetical protein